MKNMRILVDQTAWTRAIRKIRVNLQHPPRSAFNQVFARVRPVMHRLTEHLGG